MSIYAPHRPDDPSPGKGHGPASTGGAKKRKRGKRGKSQTMVMRNLSKEMTPDEVKKWMNFQQPLENLASNEAIRDRAYQWIKETVTYFQSATANIQDGWALIQQMLRGDTMEADGDAGEIHSAEMFKARETIVTRVQDAVYNYDPFYSVRGRDESDARQEKIIHQYTDYQLDADRTVEKGSDGVRSLIDYTLVVAKIWWDVKTRVVRERTYEEKEVRGEKVMVAKVAEKNKVIHARPRTQLIDPYDFFMDTQERDVQEAKTVGDHCLMSYPEIAQRAEMEGWVNWEQLKEQSPLTRGDFSESFKQERRREQAFDKSSGNVRPIEGSPPSFYVTEMWGPFNIGTDDNPDYQECVATLVNNNLVVRVQLNPYDTGHRPYAVGRANAEPFDFFGIGPFTHATRFESAITAHRQLATRGHETSISPVILAENDIDVSEVMTDLNTPYKVVHVDRIDGIQVMPTKSTLREWQFMEQVLKQDIEEVTGATRSLQGADESNTATQNVNNLRESNRRIRGYIHAHAQFVSEILRQFHLLNRQFSTKKMTFRVLGTEAAGSTVYQEIEPQVFTHDVDFEMKALVSLNTPDTRAAQTQAFLNTLYPYIPLMPPGTVDVTQLFQHLMRDMLGVIPDKVIKVPTKPEDLPTPEEENYLLQAGQAVVIDALDDDMAHIEEHLELLDEDDPQVVARVLTHVEEHRIQHNKKLQKAASEAQPGMSSMGGAQAEVDHDRGSTGSDRGGRFSMEDNPAQTPGGETPGPMNSQRMAAPDRGQSIFQQHNEASGS